MPMSQQQLLVTARYLRQYYVPLPFSGCACPGAASTMPEHLWEAWTGRWLSTFCCMRFICKGFAKEFRVIELQLASNMREVLLSPYRWSPYLDGNRPSQVRQEMRNSIEAWRSEGMELARSKRKRRAPDEGAAQRKARRTTTTLSLTQSQFADCIEEHKSLSELKEDARALGVSTQGKKRRIARAIVASFEA